LGRASFAKAERTQMHVGGILGQSWFPHRDQCDCGLNAPRVGGFLAPRIGCSNSRWKTQARPEGRAVLRCLRNGTTATWLARLCGQKEKLHPPEIRRTCNVCSQSGTPISKRARRLRKDAPNGGAWQSAELPFLFSPQPCSRALSFAACQVAAFGYRLCFIQL